MSILLDTHVLIWWVSGCHRIPARIVRSIESCLEEAEVLVSAITAWEISMLIAKGRLLLGMDVECWLETASEIEGLRFVPVSREIAVKSTLLPGEFHKDPADRMIVATARLLGIPLVTADEKILSYPHVRTLWER